MKIELDLPVIKYSKLKGSFLSNLENSSETQEEKGLFVIVEERFGLSGLEKLAISSASFPEELRDVLIKCIKLDKQSEQIVPERPGLQA